MTRNEERARLLAKRLEGVRARGDKVLQELADLLLMDTKEDLTVLLSQFMLLREEQRLIRGLIDELQREH